MNHRWTYKIGSNGAFWVGCQECGALDKAFRTEKEARARLYELKRSQIKPKSWDAYPKMSLGRRQREAKKINKWIAAFTGGSSKRPLALPSGVSVSAAEPNESSQP